MYSQFAILLCLFIAGCYGFYRPDMFSGGRRQRPLCSLPTKPCRLQVTMNHFNGTLAGEMETESCSCNGRGPCRSDWSDRNYVISRNLISMTYNMTLNMMFCQPIQPPNYCTLGQEALVVSGPMSIPTNVEQFNCRCDSNNPLYLHERRYGPDHLIYHAYVCDNHKATCPHYISHCMVIDEDSVDYTCKCSQGLFCKVQRDERDPWAYPVYGYCRP